MSVASQQLGIFINDLSLYPISLTLMATCIQYVPPATASFSNVDRLVPDIIGRLNEEHWGMNSSTVRCFRGGTLGACYTWSHYESYIGVLGL